MATSRQAVQPLPPFAVIEADDRRGALWIAVLLSLIFVVMTLGARVYVRKHMLGRDDFASMAAVALAMAQYGSLFAGMPSGLGTSKPSVTHGNERKIGTIFLASQAVFICGLYMAKFAVLLATERLLAADMKTVQRICVLLRIFLGMAALASLLMITVRCPINSVLAHATERQCSGLGWRWLAITILDAVTEVAVLSLFYGLIWSLQMRTRRKWMLTILLGLRIICPIFTGVYTSAIKSYSRSSDPAVQVMSPLVWQQVALGYSLIAALLIALMPFLRSFHTGMVMNVQNMSSAGCSAGGAVARSREQAYRLQDMSKSSGRSRRAAVPLSESEVVTRSASPSLDTQPVCPTKNLKTTHSDDGGGGGSTDALQPEPMVIQKTMDWSVQYEEGEPARLQHPGLPQYLNQDKGMLHHVSN